MAKRLFLALELPAVCRATLAQLDPRIKGMRWGREDNFHLTLSFLGNVDAVQEERLRQALGDVRVPSFFLPLRGVGSFGGARPSVVWAGVGNGHPHLFALHKHLQDALLRVGLKADLRPFHPHITLARPRGGSAAALRPFLREHAETELGMWEVKEFVLFSSRLDPAGSTYTAELRGPLA